MFIFFRRSDPILEEGGRYFVVPCVLYTFSDKLQAVGAQALDGKKKGWAGHFRGGDSKGDDLGGPDSLLHEYLVVDLAQAVHEEGGGKAFTEPLSLLSCTVTN